MAKKYFKTIFCFYLKKNMKNSKFYNRKYKVIKENMSDYKWNLITFVFEASECFLSSYLLNVYAIKEFNWKVITIY